MIKRVYNEFSKYSSDEIPAQKSYQKLAIKNGRLSFVNFSFSDSFLTDEDRRLLDKVIDGLLPYSAWFLVDRTHEEGPWHDLTYYNEEITNTSIEEYFREHPGRVYGEFN